MRRTPRHYLMVLVALMMLWQQMASAANRPPSSGQTATSAAMSAMQRTFNARQHAPAGVRFSAGSVLAPSDDTSPSLRGSLSLPLARDVPGVASVPCMEASLASAHQRHAYRPPIRLLFCSLLI